jgi:hypothetical protein
MALCKDCIHNEVCDRLYELNGIPKIGGTDCGCFKDKSDVAPKSEVAREIFEEIGTLFERFYNDASYSSGEMLYDVTDLKKKYTEVSNMTETKDYCDHCGKELDRMKDYGGTEIVALHLFTADLCAECIEELDRMVFAFCKRGSK